MCASLPMHNVNKHYVVRSTIGLLGDDTLLFILHRKTWNVAGFGSRVALWGRGIVVTLSWKVTTSSTMLLMMTAPVESHHLALSSCLATVLSRFHSVPVMPKNSSLKFRQVCLQCCLGHCSSLESWCYPPVKTDRMIVAGVVLAWYQRVTDGRLDGRLDRIYHS